MYTLKLEEGDLELAKIDILDIDLNIRHMFDQNVKYFALPSVRGQEARQNYRDISGRLQNFNYIAEDEIKPFCDRMGIEYSVTAQKATLTKGFLAR